MDRRTFLQAGAAVAASSLLPIARAAEQGWRTFEVTTRVELVGGGPSRVWVPVPTVNTAYQKVISNQFKSEGGQARIVQDPRYGAGILFSEFKPSDTPVVELVSRFSTRDRAVNIGQPTGEQLSDEERRKYLSPTELLPL